ncbi:hypothetical protein DL764_006396 [Monosporascus ibericus]|uniref:AAA+ ATPase domain-containing protein n=1 Tax=Monosporascus ibericus TaxID=155417 RepID=A0A4Q4T7Y4_9PEZI|nr:hypothetical protein DL764_006396 [Monosporascus ibericus]
MDDNCSVTSFEEVGKPSHEDFKSSEERNIERLKALIARSAASGSTARELADDEVPDVCYVLQYQGWAGKPVDGKVSVGILPSKTIGALIDRCLVRRSAEPMDIQLDGDSGEGVAPGKPKPILEIVTRVSTRVVDRSNRGWRDRRLHPGHFDHPRSRHYPAADYSRNDDDSDMQIANVEDTIMLINSVHLINALKAVVGYYPDTSFIGDSVRIDAPYRVLIHHRAALARYKVSQPETHDEEYAFTTAKHIDVLLSFLDKALGKQIREEEGRHNSDTPKATFDNLWLLLKPGSVVYAEKHSKWTPFVVSSVVTPSRSSEERPRPCTINCWNISYCVDRFVRLVYVFTIEPFTGEQAISSLQVIPERFFRGEDGDMSPSDVAAKQIKLGKIAWELTKGPVYMSYDGGLVEKEDIVDNEDEDSYPTGATGYMNGRVVIDCEGFSKYFDQCPGSYRSGRRSRRAHLRSPPPIKDQLPYFAPRCGCSACSKDDSTEKLSPFVGFEDLDPAYNDPPASDLYFLALSKIVSGFILNERRWGHFSVERLHEIKFDREAFKHLVLDDGIKLTVKALIGRFASANGRVSPWSSGLPSDFIKNKGQGRIFLLHGSPGVGKTCTAEATAELAQRPLLSLTSGDLTTWSESVERNLEYFLTLGERFGAMVLIDEADVYLETRRSRDITRNGLVSIFLRALEYYRGVLFLTTNRVQTFDSAFTSRIHVALHYKPLTDGDREKIWLNSFERLERDSAGKVHVSVSTREYAYDSQDVLGLRWNGREIRNALQTAVALAEADAAEDEVDRVTVTDKHLRHVVKMSRGFKDFLRRNRLQGQDDHGDDDDDDDDDDDQMDEQQVVDIYD